MQCPPNDKKSPGYVNPGVKIMRSRVKHMDYRFAFIGINLDGFVKSPNPVTPAKAGVQKLLKLLVSGFHRNDNKEKI
jgi:hypothetical protein